MNGVSLTLLLAVSALIATAALPSPTVAGRATAEREHAFIVSRPVAESFPLFEPVGEKQWAENWQPVFVSEADARLHDGSVFTVDRPGPGGAAVTSIWTITRYEPGRVIEYRNVLPGLRATRITVHCEPAAADQTRVTVRYAYRSLSAEGDAMIAATTDEAFRAMIDSWGTAIADFFKRGTPASP
jgi:uncharacterized membrane protein